MTGVLRVFLAEVRKLRRPTLLLSTLAAVLGISGLFTSLLYLLINSRDGNGRDGQRITTLVLSQPNGVVSGFTSTATLLGVVALCIFSAQTAQEYTFGTLRNLLVRQPSRLKILGGKYLSMALFAFIMIVLSLIVSVSISFALAGHAHVSTKLWTTHAGIHAILNAFGNMCLAAVCFGTFGMILGLVLRSPISSIAIGVIWVLIVELLLTLVIKHADRWLPGQLFGTIGAGGMEGISYRHAVTFSLVYLVVAGGLATGLFKGRDVAN